MDSMYGQYDPLAGPNTPAIGYGICLHSVIPVRRASGHRGEMTSQLIFGEHYKVLDISADRKWLLIENAYDLYRGWIEHGQHKEISKDFFDAMGTLQWPVSKDLIGLIHGRSRVFPVLYGSIMPVYNNGIIVVEKDAYRFQGQVFFPTSNCTFKDMENISRFFVSAPYLWGGRTIFGIDCSGFVQHVFRLCGKKLPRDAYQQALEGTNITFKDALPGDLAFFNDLEGKVTHVGIVAENNLIIHASGQVKYDLLDEKGILDRETGIYSHSLHSLKRI